MVFALAGDSTITRLFAIGEKNTPDASGVLTL
jgi:hypothetical protein